ncbi:MAG TPA: hypothetical protein VM735_09620, partial [Candidatus Kapabacteria bacterium]|nr:hypothetical protein [Candidatus Kapabacteria bacterium]
TFLCFWSKPRINRIERRGANIDIELAINASTTNYIERTSRFFAFPQSFSAASGPISGTGQFGKIVTNYMAPIIPNEHEFFRVRAQQE